MVKVKIFRNSAGEIIGFTAAGHAQYDEVGKDVVCAAISTLLVSAVNGIFYLELQPKLDVKDGWLSCHLQGEIAPAKMSHVQTIFAVMLIGLLDIEQAYKTKLKVIDDAKEV